MTKKSRSKAYFIIQPDGTVIVPTDINKSYTAEKFVGDLKTESINDVFIKWSKLVSKSRTNKNLESRRIEKEQVYSVFVMR